MPINPRFLFATFLALIVGIVFLSSPSMLLAEKKMPTPDDFEIYLLSSPRLPMYPAAYLTIDSSGHCKYFERPRGKDAQFVLINELNLDAEAMKKIYVTIQKQKFFDLRKEYKDPEIMDGDFALMKITANGKKHQVKTINIKVDAFDDIVREINAHLPKGMRISYNALHVDKYKREKR